MNLIPMIREQLGLDENEEFNLINPNEVPFPEHFRFTDDSLQMHYPQGWEQAQGTILRALLRGDLKVVKIPFKPKEGEDYYFVDVSTGYVFRTIYVIGYCRDTLRNCREMLRISSGNCYQTEEEAEKHVDEWMSKVYGENWKELLK